MNPAQLRLSRHTLADIFYTIATVQMLRIFKYFVETYLTLDFIRTQNLFLVNFHVKSKKSKAIPVTGRGGL
jgi:hypothetical protein